MAVCNANYQLILLVIGDSGRNSDGGVFSNCLTGQVILSNQLDFPSSEMIVSSEKYFLFVFVGDDSFALK